MPLSTGKIEWSADYCSESSEFSLDDYCDIEQSLNSAVYYTDIWEQASKCSSFSKSLDKDVSSIDFFLMPSNVNHLRPVPKCNVSAFVYVEQILLFLFLQTKNSWFKLNFFNLILFFLNLN